MQYGCVHVASIYYLLYLPSIYYTQYGCVHVTFSVYLLYYTSPGSMAACNYLPFTILNHAID